MARVKRAVHGAKAKRTTMELAKGYRGSRGRHHHAANEQVMHALRYAYRDRRARKGGFPAPWTSPSNPAVRAARKLARPSARARAGGRFLLEGPEGIRAALDAGHVPDSLLA